jgi:vacuolar-type H+-ATPase subunit I/STV1
MVDPDAYKFTTFDFVVDPGFTQASPNLAESFIKLLEELKNSAEPNFKGESEMSQQLLESLAKENGSLKVNLDEAAKEVVSLKDSNTALAESNRHIKSEADRMRSQLKMLERYKQLGSPEELDRVLSEAEKQGSKIKAIGGVAKCSEALDKSAQILTKYRKIGTPAEITEALHKSKATVQAYAKFGKVSEIDAAFVQAESVVRVHKADKSKKRISELARELKVSEDAVKKVYGKMPEPELKEFFKSLGEVRGPAAIFRKSGATGKSVNESKEFESVMSKSRAARLMESFG